MNLKLKLGQIREFKHSKSGNIKYIEFTPPLDGRIKYAIVADEGESIYPCDQHGNLFTMYIYKPKWNKLDRNLRALGYMGLREHYGLEE
jgi:hypothetical protein